MLYLLLSSFIFFSNLFSPVDQIFIALFSSPLILSSIYSSVKPFSDFFFMLLLHFSLLKLPFGSSLFPC